MKYHVVKLHTDCNINFIGIRYDLQLVMLLHKYLHNVVFDPGGLGLAFKPSPPGDITTRASNTNELSYPLNSLKTDLRKSPLYRGILIWNQLSPECRQTVPKEAFKTLAKEKITTLYMKRWYRHLV